MARGQRSGRAFHKSDEKRIEETRSLLINSVEKGKITPEDGDLIRKYLAEASAETGISPVRKY